MHKFNGIDIRTPTDFSWGLEDVEAAGSATTLDGKDHSVIATQKRILNYVWKDPTKEEVAAILTLVNQSRYVTITYPDAMSGTYETREFKPTSKSAPLRTLRVGALLYSTLTLGFRER